MNKLSLFLLRKSFLAICKSFIGLNLHYTYNPEVTYDELFNKSFKNKIEMTQYHAYLVFTGKIKGTSQNVIYQELGLKSFSGQRSSRKLFFFHKLPRVLYLRIVSRI